MPIRDDRSSVPTTDESFNERFVTLVTENQPSVLAYVHSLLGDHHRAADVLQETNVVLWRKRAEFDFTREFLPWALTVARFQVLAHLRDRGRDRTLLDSETVEAVAGEAAQQAAHVDSMQVALRACIEKLSPRHQALIRNRYFSSMSIGDVATAQDSNRGAVKAALLRARRQLGQCVRQSMATGG